MSFYLALQPSQSNSQPTIRSVGKIVAVAGEAATRRSIARVTGDGTNCGKGRRDPGAPGGGPREGARRPRGHACGGRDPDAWRNFGASRARLLVGGGGGDGVERGLSCG